MSQKPNISHLKEEPQTMAMYEENSVSKNSDAVAVINNEDGLKELDHKIDNMMRKVDGYWNCLQCGKCDRNVANVRDHIEAKHIEGVSHSCPDCGKYYRSRNSLRFHRSKHHNMSL